MWFWCGDLKERENLEDLGVDGRIVLELILMHYTEGTWTGLLWLRIGEKWRAVVNAVMNL
jgi:hypothetical protein